MNTITKILVLSLLTLMLACGAASAHTYSYNADQDRNGTIEVFKSSSLDLGGEWEDYRLTANRQLRSDVPNAPTIKMVRHRVWADVIMTSGEDPRNCGGPILNSNAVDYFIIENGCTPGEKWFSHEFGHEFALAHHDCDPLWKSLTAMVAGLNSEGKVVSGCKVQITGFGSHDLQSLRNKY
jgi:hypothetical protein